MPSYILSDTHMLLFVTKIFIFIIMQDENITNDEDCDATIHKKNSSHIYSISIKRINGIELETSKRITESMHDFFRFALTSKKSF